MNGLVAGDAHGDLSFMQYIIEKAHEFNCWTIVQLGDFGYWGDFIEQVFILNMDISRKLDKVVMPEILFIDGNHEHHIQLRKDIVNPNIFTQTNLPEYLSNNIPTGIKYIPRGTIFKLGNKTCMGVGGAHSIDKNERQPGVDWFEEELITAEEFQSALRHESRKIDILFTHDVPTEFYLPLYGIGQETNRNRRFISLITKWSRPDRMFCGHYHTNKKETICLEYQQDTVVQILDCNLTPNQAWTVIEV